MSRLEIILIQYSNITTTTTTIHFSYDDEAAFQRNFGQKLSSMASLLNLLYPRNLTLHGRIVILKALALSKLIYNTAVLTVTPTFNQKVNKAITQFVWHNKIKQTMMIGPKEKGGLVMPDFDTINNALKATWMRILDSCHLPASWTHVPVSRARTSCWWSVSTHVQCNFELKHLNIHIPSIFYEKALLAWQSINSFTPSSKEEILDELPEGYSSEFLVGVCRPVPKILTQFQTKIFHFHTRFQTWPLKSIPVFRPLLYRN